MLIWAALRFGPRAAASANLLVGVVAISGTALGLGPFVRPDLADSLLYLQAFLSTFAFASLCLAAVAVERARDWARTKDANRSRGAILEAAPDAIVTMDARGVIREFNSSAERLFGVRRTDVLGKEMAALLAPPSPPSAGRDRRVRPLPWEAPSLGKRVTLSAFRSDGREFPAEVIVIRIPIDGPPVLTGFIRDLSSAKAACAYLHIVPANDWMRFRTFRRWRNPQLPAWI